MTTMAKLIEVQVFERGRSRICPVGSGSYHLAQRFFAHIARNEHAWHIGRSALARNRIARFVKGDAGSLEHVRSRSRTHSNKYRIGIHDALIARIPIANENRFHMRHGHFPIGRRPNRFNSRIQHKLYVRQFGKRIEVKDIGTERIAPVHHVHLLANTR